MEDKIELVCFDDSKVVFLGNGDVRTKIKEDRELSIDACFDLHIFNTIYNLEIEV